MVQELSAYNLNSIDQHLDYWERARLEMSE